MQDIREEQQNVWELSSFKKTGKYHADHGMRCQDQVFYRENYYSQAIVLADGAGDSDANVPCVEEVAEFTAEVLLRFSKGEEALCQAMMLEYLMGGIVGIISKYMDRSHLGAEMFGSTLMGAAVNHREGRYLLLHLGDGIIIGSNGQQSRVLSYPVNRKADQTVLTISENIPERIKVKSGDLGDLSRIVLCSDGVYDWPVNSSFTDQTVWELLSGGRDFEEKDDDQSYIQLRRREHVCFSGNS